GPPRSGPCPPDFGAARRRTGVRGGDAAGRRHHCGDAALPGGAARVRTIMPKVLLVEDNEMNRDMLSRRLIRRGFEVILAVDGEQGVEAAHRERPAIVLMDMSLPVLDGWEATRRLKS